MQTLNDIELIKLVEERSLRLGSKGYYKISIFYMFLASFSLCYENFSRINDRKDITASSKFNHTKNISNFNFLFIDFKKTKLYIEEFCRQIKNKRLHGDFEEKNKNTCTKICLYTPPKIVLWYVKYDCLVKKALLTLMKKTNKSIIDLIGDKTLLYKNHKQVKKLNNFIHDKRTRLRKSKNSKDKKLNVDAYQALIIFITTFCYLLLILFYKAIFSDLIRLYVLKIKKMFKVLLHIRIRS